MQGKTYEEILDYIRSLTIYDTHEHLPYTESARKQPTDVLDEYLIHYFSIDIENAGLSKAQKQRVRDITLPLMQRWKLAEPYWNLARSTGYGRALDIAVRDLYGLPGINADTIEELNRRFQAALASGTHFEYVLKEKSKIALSILDSNPDCDRRYFRTVFRLDTFIMPVTGEALDACFRWSGIRPVCFSEWLEACEEYFSRMVKIGAVALKCGLAYSRPLYFPRATYAEAEDAFNRYYSYHNQAGDMNMTRVMPGEVFGNYMMHFALSLCNKYGLPIQIHTGIQEGTCNRLAHSNPEQLANLFIEYPDVRFDIFHIGYPYQNILCAMAKQMPNVFIDMCWAHVISPNASACALSEFLDALPLNKVNAFGGDYCFVDGVYGHQYLARQTVAKVLSQKIEDGAMDMDTARFAAHRMFIDNPKELFRLDV